MKKNLLPLSPLQNLSLKGKDRKTLRAHPATTGNAYGTPNGLPQTSPSTTHNTASTRHTFNATPPLTRTSHTQRDVQLDLATRPPLRPCRGLAMWTCSIGSYPGSLCRATLGGGSARSYFFTPTWTALPHLCSSDASPLWGVCPYAVGWYRAHHSFYLLPLATGVQPSTCVAYRFCHMTMLRETLVSPLHGHLPRTTTSLSSISAYSRHFHLSGTYACCTDSSTSQLTTLLHRHSSVHSESRQLACG